MAARLPTALKMSDAPYRLLEQGRARPHEALPRRKGEIMKATLRCLLVVLALAAVTHGVALAERPEVAEGLFVEDFEAGGLKKFGIDEREQKQASRVPAILEIARDGGRNVLHLKGNFQNRVYLKDREFEDFALTVRMKKTTGSYAGVVVRDHWRVYLQMKRFLSLNSDAASLESKGQLLRSDRAFPGYHELKVVCAGPLLHAFVDGEHVFTHRIGPGRGRVGFYAHGNGEGFYDDLRVDTRVAPEHYVLVEPEAADDCLVFPPDEDARLRFKVDNYWHSAQKVTVSACVKRWRGEVVKEEARREIAADGGGESTAEFDLGPLRAGFYCIDLKASCEGKLVASIDDLPLAVQQRGSGGFTPPAIPIAAYYKYYNKTSPLYVNTYAHAAARSLRDHGFNAVVADPSFDEEAISVFQSYGVATIARGRFLEHPGVIATLTSDEPKAEEVPQLKENYEKLREVTDKPITTCLVGDAMGLRGEEGPLWIWRQLEPELRCFRWYGIKKSFYGILHDVKYKPYLPLSSVLMIAEASGDTPYWLVAPSLGKTDHEAYYHKPTPAETKGMMHLALAHGADGILFFAFQSHGSWLCLVDQKSLEPTDGCYAAAAEVALKIQPHHDLIKSLEHGGLDVRCPSPVVDAVPRRSSRDGKRYVYVVNKDARSSVTTRLLLWAERWALSGVRDVYSARSLSIERDEEGYLSVPLTLEPGGGWLLAMDVADAQAKK
jgi:hypothetical protein